MFVCVRVSSRMQCEDPSLDFDGDSGVIGTLKCPSDSCMQFDVKGQVLFDLSMLLPLLISYTVHESSKKAMRIDFCYYYACVFCIRDLLPIYRLCTPWHGPDTSPGILRFGPASRGMTPIPGHIPECNCPPISDATSFRGFVVDHEL